MYNFKKNAKLYIVENGNKHSIEIYSDLSASQTFDEQSYKLKTLHNLNALHDGATITKANVANFTFTTPIHNVASGIPPIVLTLGTSYSNGTISSFDIYIESDYVIYKIEKSVIEALTFNIEKNSVLTVSISGTAAKISTYSTSALPVAIPGTPVVMGTKNYVAIKGLNVSIANTVLTAITSINIDIKNEVSWTDYNTMQGTLNNTVGYPTNYVVTGRAISGSVTQFITTENVTTISDISTGAPIVIDIYDSNTTVSPLLEFNLPSTVFTRRLNMEEIFNRVYDFRLNTNTNTSGITYKGQTLYLDFLAGAPLDSRITFTRSSTATFTGSNGLIQTATINAPRFDYDPVTLAAKGLLIEEQRTNLVTYSEEFQQAAWTKTDATVSANAAVAPDNATTADKIVEGTGTGVHDVRRSLAAAASTAYTQSIFLKASERTKGQLQMFGNSVGNTVEFDLVAVTATSANPYGGWTASSATITDFGRGWFRITNTATTNVGLTSLFVAYLLEDAGGSASYSGDGASGMFYWGAQLEAGAFATSYIPTVASQVTRTADVATMTGTNFSSWYNQSEGTMQCNFALEGLAPSGTADIWLINDGSSANSIRLRQGIVITGSDVTMLTGNVVQIDSNSLSTPTNTNRKTAFAWSSLSSNLTGNGISLGNGGVITPPVVTQLVLTGSNKWLQQLAFYPTRLTNVELQALTS